MEVKNVKRLSNTRQLRDFARIASENQYRKILITRTNTVLSNPLKEAGWELIKAIPHKERTAKRSEKRYNKEVKKQLTMSLINDELGAGINEEKQRDPEAHSVKKGKGDFNE